MSEEKQAECWAIDCTRLLTLTFLSAAMFINIYNVLMLFERFSLEEVATAQLPCASDINIYHCRSINKVLYLHIFFTYLCLKFFSYNCKLQI